MIGQLRSHETNRSRVTDNNNISQLLRDSFSVSQQPPIWEPPSHYSMFRTLKLFKLVENELKINHNLSAMTFSRPGWFRQDHCLSALRQSITRAYRQCRYQLLSRSSADINMMKCDHLHTPLAGLHHRERSVRQRQQDGARHRRRSAHRGVR